MTFLIYEKDAENFSGQFVAEIACQGKKKKMYYDLSTQEDTYDGYYTDKAVVFLHPKPATFKFNVEYTLPDAFDEIVAFLGENGWGS